MDGNLYDEFGNYIGPELDDDEEEEMGFVPPHEDEEMQDQDEEQAPAQEEEGVSLADYIFAASYLILSIKNQHLEL